MGLLIFIFQMPVVFAQNVAPSGDVGFTVKALLPENQRDSNVTYFDLRVKPDEIQSLEVEVENSSSKPFYVTVDPADAGSSNAGDIAYYEKGQADIPAECAFSTIAYAEQEYMLLQPGEKKIAKIIFTTPKEPFDGCILGGIKVTQYPTADALPALNGDQKKLDEFLNSVQDSDTTKSAASPTVTEGIGVESRIAYAIAVMLTETDTIRKPDFSMDQVKAQTIDLKTAIVFPLQNTEPVLAKDVKADFAVYQLGDNKTLYQKSSAQLDFAPNAMLSYAMYIEKGSVPPGEYIVEVQLQGEEKTWNFDGQFTVDKNASTQLENEQLIKPVEVVETTPQWLLPVIVAVVAIFAVSIIFFIITMHRRRNGNK